MFLAVIAASIFYLFPGATHFSSIAAPSSDLLAPLELKSAPSHIPSQEQFLPAGIERNEIHASDHLPNAASRDASITASVHLEPEMSEVHLENTGSLPLNQIQITSKGRSLGKISMLDSREKKVLAVSGSPREITVNALDP
ncbi:MAG: hypothetical protein HGA68_01385, partial [Methanothrix sp.]|nr:hypothetical protein [Methanothrix sp.]